MRRMIVNNTIVNCARGSVFRSATVGAAYAFIGERRRLDDKISGNAPNRSPSGQSLHQDRGSHASVHFEYQGGSDATVSDNSKLTGERKHNVDHVATTPIVPGRTRDCCGYRSEHDAPALPEFVRTRMARTSTGRQRRRPAAYDLGAYEFCRDGGFQWGRHSGWMAAAISAEPARSGSGERRSRWRFLFDITRMDCRHESDRSTLGFSGGVDQRWASGQCAIPKFRKPAVHALLFERLRLRSTGSALDAGAGQIDVRATAACRR